METTERIKTALLREFIRRRRKELFSSQADMAEACQAHGWDASEKQIQRAETSLQRFTPAQLVGIAGALGLTIEELINQQEGDTDE